MSRQPRISRNHDEMTIEEIQIALSFLKKRFNQYSMPEIIFSLTQELQKDRFTSNNHHHPPNNQQTAENQGRPSLMFRTRHTRFSRDQRELRQKVYSISVNNEQKLNKFQQIRLVAKFFCQTGINYSLIRYFFPLMSPQQYRSYLQTINNQAINQIQKFLRYQCNIQIQHISADQKRTLKNQLIKVRDWLGHKNLSELQTYYKFIQRHYEQKDVEITYDEALKLYKTLLQTIKSPYVDVMEALRYEKQDRPPAIPSNNQRNSLNLWKFTKEEQKNVALQFINTLDIKKVSQKLSKNWGQSTKWNENVIRQVLLSILKKTLKKILISKETYLKRATFVYFNDSLDYAKNILQSQDKMDLKLKLFKFFIANRVTATGLNKVIYELNDFFNKDLSTSVLELINDDDQIKIISKIEYDDNFQQRKGKLQVETGCSQAVKQENPQLSRIQAALFTQYMQID